MKITSKCLLPIFLVPYLLGFTSLAEAQTLACNNKKGGWRSLCLQEQAQAADESANKTYWVLRDKIQELQNVTQNKPFVEQFKKLLRRNELDYINYTESYCNMQNYILAQDTEINKILFCQINTAELRQSELEKIIRTITYQTSTK